MIKPTYDDTNLVNLMSTIASRFDIKLPYKQLANPQLPDLSEFNNIVLIVIDGLGYEYLKKNGDGTVLSNNALGPLSTVFPATTATGISTICTGLAPQQHAITGWFMYVKELNEVIRILPYTKAGDENLLDFPIENLIDVTPLSAQMEYSSVITSESIADTIYTRYMSKNAYISSYTNMKQFFRLILNSLSHQTPHFTYAYWPTLDTINHISGPESNDSIKHFQEINSEFEEFLRSIRGTNTLVITTADHGFVETNPKTKIEIGNHPKLQSCLKFPLSGEPRASFCHVKRGMDDMFIDYVSSKLDHICDLYSTLELIKDNWFGLFQPNTRLYERIGDYALLPKENYYFVQKYNGKALPEFLGLHGGISKDEIFIPLIMTTSSY
jgi:hypothetical protein